MFFIRWNLLTDTVMMVLTLAILVALPAACLWMARRKRFGIRMMIGLVCTPFVGCGILLFCLEVSPMGKTTYSKPIFSPDHRMAARIVEGDDGATGGSSTVVVYSKHGLRQQIVASGPWQAILDGDVRWVSPTGLETRYRRPLVSCTDATEVSVHCIRYEDDLMRRLPSQSINP
jgi:hypothetical protein